MLPAEVNLGINPETNSLTTIFLRFVIFPIYIDEQRYRSSSYHYQYEEICRCEEERDANLSRTINLLDRHD